MSIVEKVILAKILREDVMMGIGESFENFLFYCKFEKNLSEKSLKAYEIDLVQFNSFLKYNQIETIESITKETIRKYINSMEKRYKPKSLKRKLAIVKALFNYLEYDYENIINPFRKMKIRITDPETLPTFLEISEVKRIFQTVYTELRSSQLTQSRQNTIIRDLAILELLFATGIRVSELCNIKHDDINLATGLITVYGKGSKKRLIRINTKETLTALRNYYRVSIKTADDPNYFFLNRLKNQISTQSVRLMVKKYAKKANLSKKITPHVFRHTYATLLLEADIDLVYIQHLLGHSSITTTQIYTHVNTKKIDKLLIKKHPRLLLSAG